MNQLTPIPPKQELLASLKASGIEFAPITAARLQFIGGLLPPKGSKLTVADHCEMFIALTQPLETLIKAWSAGRDVFRAEAVNLFQISRMPVGALIGSVGLGLEPLRRLLPPERTRRGEPPGSHWN